VYRGWDLMVSDKEKKKEVADLRKEQSGIERRRFARDKYEQSGIERRTPSKEREKKPDQ